MEDLPHRYLVVASAHGASDVALNAARVRTICSASPAEFGGPGDRWSPETLLVGALADCFILTFRAVAQASKLQWNSLHCDATGVLDRVDRAMQFTRFDLDVELAIPPDTDPALAKRLLEKAERGCLVSNSLKAPVTLTTAIVAGKPAAIQYAAS